MGEDQPDHTGRGEWEGDGGVVCKGSDPLVAEPWRWCAECVCDVS